MSRVKIKIKNTSHEFVYDDVINLNYNYNDVGDIQIEYGKYQKDYAHFMIKDVERMDII